MKLSVVVAASVALLLMKDATVAAPLPQGGSFISGIGKVASKVGSKLGRKKEFTISEEERASIQREIDAITGNDVRGAGPSHSLTPASPISRGHSRSGSESEIPSLEPLSPPSSHFGRNTGNELHTSFAEQPHHSERVTPSFPGYTQPVRYVERLRAEQDRPDHAMDFRLIPEYHSDVYSLFSHPSTGVRREEFPGSENYPTSSGYPVHDPQYVSPAGYWQPGHPNSKK